jgi:monothiol glutaredoxin
MEEVLRSIEKEIKENDIVLFMKGTKSAPMCGFSASVCKILSKLGVEFKDINILANESLRQGIKEYSKWPTIPQLYIKGEFIGGSDITEQLYEAGELQKILNV